MPPYVQEYNINWRIRTGVWIWIWGNCVASTEAKTGYADFGIEGTGFYCVGAASDLCAAPGPQRKHAGLFGVFILGKKR